ncbi:uncharacterized protein Dwil_GK14387 [Drosophila willistoni]|uniref:Uncharacterized protein n=2 Tax=Drosophila willistoni TaxID=7260 RepID=B4NJC1_DROWI|nr:uncharacterized protein LOC6650215 isoform X1 [Drosophila willistoni]EDW84952.1 uncharacterized protein Dwil_GK14387 [Drosophila willistoni]
MRIAPLVQALVIYVQLMSTLANPGYSRQHKRMSMCMDQKEDDSCGLEVKGGNSKQTASNIAQKAALEAKHASDTQQAAAEAAGRQVKVQLADKAIAAAKAAEAALAGKQQLLEQLTEEVREAENVFQEESSSMNGSQCNLDSAANAAKQAQMLLQALQNAIKIAQQNLSNAEAAANGAQQEMQEKAQLVEAARNRIELLLRQLNAAKVDYDNTKRAAYKAACAASEARQKATRDRRADVRPGRGRQ